MIPISSFIICATVIVTVLSADEEDYDAHNFRLFRLTPALNAGKWKCGNDEQVESIAEGIIDWDCPRLRNAVNRCCVAYDLFYTQQIGRTHCDDVFCECLLEATRPNFECHNRVAPTFCLMVRKFGVKSLAGASAVSSP